ncbi:MAG: FAD-dependent oxidoreductase, partial [Gammaproteobacteria bacterium]
MEGNPATRIEKLAILPRIGGISLHLHYDLIVIGSGPAGKRAAIQAAKVGKSVLLVEKNEIVGGVTVHTGTIPS